MEKLPEDVMIEKILLKLPTNSLMNLRYVSKDLWRLITSPSFTKLHFQHSSSIAQLNNNNNNYHNLLLICSREFVPDVYSCRTLAHKPVIHNYVCSFPIITTSPKIAEMHLPFESTEIRASCNGLLYLHQRLISWIDGRQIKDIANYIWNPCTKEYKQLPPPPPSLLVVDSSVDVGNYCSNSGFCGFGYDRNNDEYKILHYENRVHHNYIVDKYQFREIQSISSVIEFKLYTLGTNTWTLIVDNPYRSFYFKEGSSKEIGLLVNGALHWKYYMDYTESLVCLNSGTYTIDNRRKRHIDSTITNCIIDLTQHNPEKEGDSSNIFNGKKRKRTLTELAS